METDCKSVYEALIHQIRNIDIDNVELDIHSWLDKFIDIRFSLMSRESNQAADMLAKRSFCQSVLSHFLCIYPPNCLRGILFNDYVN